MTVTLWIIFKNHLASDVSSFLLVLWGHVRRFLGERTPTWLLLFCMPPPHFELCKITSTSLWTQELGRQCYNLHKFRFAGKPAFFFFKLFLCMFRSCFNTKQSRNTVNIFCQISPALWYRFVTRQLSGTDIKFFGTLQICFRGRYNRNHAVYINRKIQFFKEHHD